MKKIILDYITAHPSASCREIAEETGIDGKRVAAYLSDMTENGVLRREGENKSYRYFATGAPAKFGTMRRSPLSRYSDAELLAELKARDYEGTLFKKQSITL